MKILEKNKDITHLSNFKTKAKASYFFEIKNEIDLEKLKKINEFASEKNLKILFIWWWTNMFFAFNKFDGIIIKNSLNGWKYNSKTKVLKSFSNENISNIAYVLELEETEFTWHRFIGLPWTIGWAVYWNAWCFWLETENNFVSAKIFDLKTKKIKYFYKKNMKFSYRNSILKEKDSRYFLISAKFDLSKKIEKYHSNIDNIDFRENKQPRWNTCWSFFKNPKIELWEFFKKFPKLKNKNLKKISAWFLIENIWFKWKKIWGAFFSDLHANFLMNDGNAKWKNLDNLIKLIQKKVKKKFDVELVNEVRIIKNEIK